MCLADIDKQASKITKECMAIKERMTYLVTGPLTQGHFFDLHINVDHYYHQGHGHSCCY